MPAGTSVGRQLYLSMYVPKIYFGRRHKRKWHATKIVSAYVSRSNFFFCWRGSPMSHRPIDTMNPSQPNRSNQVNPKWIHLRNAIAVALHKDHGPMMSFHSSAIIENYTHIQHNYTQHTYGGIVLNGHSSRRHRRLRHMKKAEKNK